MLFARYSISARVKMVTAAVRYMVNRIINMECFFRE